MIELKPYLLQTLKELALLGAMKNRVEISSQELAKKLETSQQTASRYILELEKKKFVTRDLGIKKQLIYITTDGTMALEEEFLQYQQIFEMADRINFKGKVVSGLGEGKYYTEQEGYFSQFKEKLGFEPFPGTLNVEIDAVERNKLRLLKRCIGIEIQGFKTDNRTFGNVVCFPAVINKTKGAIVLPRRSHYSNILEFISPFELRDKLCLRDSDEVDITIYREECEE